MKANFDAYCEEMEESLRGLLAGGMDEYKKFMVSQTISEAVPLENREGLWAKMMREFEFPVCWLSEEVKSLRESAAGLVADAEKSGLLHEDSVDGLVPEAYATSPVEQLLTMEPQDFNVASFPSNIEVHSASTAYMFVSWFLRYATLQPNKHCGRWTTLCFVYCRKSLLTT